MPDFGDAVYLFAVSTSGLALYAFGAMAVFFIVLAVGFIYEWKVGAMDW